MISALLLAVATATATPSPAASHSFSGGNVQPIGPSSNPLLKKAAPGASANPHALRQFSGAYSSENAVQGAGNQGGTWGWAGLFGVLGLFGLWRAAR
ncbi:MAG TPA: hypothetical protein VKT72_06490 [Candidatus Baltobacteraceae bacterium]|nr:hypothetical protein [Candidatus Baltobacteraceae bacterium]